MIMKKVVEEQKIVDGDRDPFILLYTYHITHVTVAVVCGVHPVHLI